MGRSRFVCLDTPAACGHSLHQVEQSLVTSAKLFALYWTPSLYDEVGGTPLAVSRLLFIMREPDGRVRNNCRAKARRFRNGGDHSGRPVSL